MELKHNAWKDLINEVEKARQANDAYFDDPLNETKYCNKEESYFNVAKKGVKAGLATPGTSLTGPPPMNQTDLIVDGATSLIN